MSDAWMVMEQLLDLGLSVGGPLLHQMAHSGWRLIGMGRFPAGCCENTSCIQMPKSGVPDWEESERKKTIRIDFYYKKLENCAVVALNAVQKLQ